MHVHAYTTIDQVAAAAADPAAAAAAAAAVDAAATVDVSMLLPVNQYATDISRTADLKKYEELVRAYGQPPARPQAAPSCGYACSKQLSSTAWGLDRLAFSCS